MNYNTKQIKDLSQKALNMEWENHPQEYSWGQEMDADEKLRKEYGLVAIRTSPSSGIVFEKSTKKLVFVFDENIKSRNRGWDVYNGKPIFKYVYDDDEYQSEHPISNYSVPEKDLKGHRTNAPKKHPAGCMCHLQNSVRKMF